MAMKLQNEVRDMKAVFFLNFSECKDQNCLNLAKMALLISARRLSSSKSFSPLTPYFRPRSFLLTFLFSADNSRLILKGSEVFSRKTPKLLHNLGGNDATNFSGNISSFHNFLFRYIDTLKIL